MKRSPWAECHPGERHYALGLCKECYRRTYWERERHKKEPWREDWEPKRFALFVKLTINREHTIHEALKRLDEDLPMPEERRGARGKVSA